MSSNTIKIKAGSGTPTTSDIQDKELAFDRSADKLYINDAGSIVDLTGSASSGDIEGVTAGTGLSGGGTSGTVTLNIDSTVATLTGSQTLTNKTLASPAFTGDINFTDASTPVFNVTDTTNTVTTKIQSADSAGLVGTSTDHNFNIVRNNVSQILLQDGFLIINNPGNDVDVNIKDSSANSLFRTDAANSRVGILDASPSFTLDVNGTGRFTGAVQLDDNLTVSGNLIADTIDVAGDITLDADGADIILKDGGTEFGRLTNFLGGLTLKTGSSSSNGLIFSADGTTMITGGSVQMSGGFVLDGNTITGVDDSGEFTDDDAHIMTSAAVNDRILSFGYITTDTNTVTTNIAGTGINVSSGTGNSTISTDDSEIVHDNLSGFVSNEHINHTSVSILGGAGLTGGGTIAASRNIHVGAGTGITVNTDDVAINFKDEDDMSSNSASHAATQQSIKAYVDAEVAGIVNSAPSALNTLDELAAALGDDANFATTTSTALGNRLRVDTASQGLTGTQQANAITNLGITATKAELNYVDGVTSAIQTQLDAKLTSSSSLNGSNISSGTVAAARIANLAASKITSGTLGTARIPNLDAAKIVSGTFDAARIAHNSFHLGASSAETGRTVKETGLYTYEVNNANLGTGTETGYYEVLTYGEGTGGSVQIAGQWFSGTYPNLYFRTLRDVNDDWTTWQRLLTTSDEGSGNGLDADTLDGSHASAFLTSVPNHSGNLITSGTVAAARIANLGASKITSGTFADARIPNLGASKITSGELATARVNWDSTDKTVRWDDGRGYHGNPRSMAIGFSGANYGQFGYNIEFTTTSGQHTASFSDIATRVDMHDGLRVYTSGSVATGGSTISWTELLRCQNNTFTYKGSQIPTMANGSNNRVMTSNDAFSINGESNLTFDGTTLQIDNRLHLDGTTPFIRIQESGVTNNPEFWIGVDGGSFSIRLNNTGTYPLQFITDSDNDTVTEVNLGYNTVVQGSVSASNDVVAFSSSDKRLKDNLKPIENSLDKVSKLSGYEFDWNDKQETYQGHDVGVIAQEIEEVLPEVVQTRDTGYKAVKYEKIVPLLIEAIKELKTEIEELKK